MRNHAYCVLLAKSLVSYDIIYHKQLLIYLDNHDLDVLQDGLSSHQRAYENN